MLLAPTLLAVLLSADAPTLNADERRYFGEQLQKVVQHARKDLEADGIRCEVTAMPKPGAAAPPEDRPGEWVSAEARSFLGSWQPTIWSVFFSCSQKGGAKFRLAFALHRDLVPAQDARGLAALLQDDALGELTGSSRWRIVSRREMIPVHHLKSGKCDDTETS